MNNTHHQYVNPLCKRYASEEMQYIFSEDYKFSTWRRLWVALAESQRELGLDISAAQIEEMQSHISDIDYDAAESYEADTRHDVMAHILTYGDKCPSAKPIIHLGATSCYVGDNTDIILQRAALLHIKRLLVNLIGTLCKFANRNTALPCLAYTHFQAAQPTTLGKRATMWIQDLIMDLGHLDYALEHIKLLGCRGTTGTAASFLELFDGDHDKVKQLEQKIAVKVGFNESDIYPVSGQTYSRKVDYYTLSVLSGIAQSAAKFSNDIRLMSHLKEIDEPSEESQVGSSAMAYKRNPVRCERITALSRHVTVNALNPAFTASAQWLERTLDDSANRRICIPEAFLGVDAILLLYINIAGGMTVYPKTMKKHLDAELPFLASEHILMHCVKKGGDRQVLHERIRVHSLEAAKNVKTNGGKNDLIDRIKADTAFALLLWEDELKQMLNPEKYTGRARQQTQEFLLDVKENVLRKNKDLLGISVDISV
ncbi:MAG: adenylosuccinate lyase [Oscillospiraceae bacterium]|nr:adenylosuccinate lyase [Oscillospiraceae bacterium]